MMWVQVRPRMRSAWGWLLPAARSCWYRWRAHSLPLRVSPAKSQMASRNFLLAHHRKVTARCLPETRVDGVTPARLTRASGSGNRARQSPISARRVAARVVPARTVI